MYILFFVKVEVYTGGLFFSKVSEAEKLSSDLAQARRRLVLLKGRGLVESHERLSVIWEAGSAGERLSLLSPWYESVLSSQTQKHLQISKSKQKLWEFGVSFSFSLFFCSFCVCFFCSFSLFGTRIGAQDEAV